MFSLKPQNPSVSKRYGSFWDMGTKSFLLDAKIPMVINNSERAPTGSVFSIFGLVGTNSGYQCFLMGTEKLKWFWMGPFLSCYAS